MKRFAGFAVGALIVAAVFGGTSVSSTDGIDLSLMPAAAEAGEWIYHGCEPSSYCVTVGGLYYCADGAACQGCEGWTYFEDPGWSTICFTRSGGC